MLTGAIEDVSEQLNINQGFLGLIVLPIAGNVTEHLTVRSGAAAAARRGAAAPQQVAHVCVPTCLACHCPSLAPAGPCLYRRCLRPARTKVDLSGSGFIDINQANLFFNPMQAVFVAAKNKMDLSIGIALGSSIQVCCACWAASCLAMPRCAERRAVGLNAARHAVGTPHPLSAAQLSSRVLPSLPSTGGAGHPAAHRHRQLAHGQGLHPGL